MSVAIKLTGNQKAAFRMFSRENGATVEQVASALKLPNTKAARGLVDRLREHKVKVKNVGHHTFQIPKSRAKGGKSATA